MPATIWPVYNDSRSTELATALGGGKLRCCYERFTLASDPVGAYNIGHPIPRGAVVLGGYLLSTVSLGTSTVAVGIASAPGKYRAAATFTAVDTPVWFGVGANLGVILAAEERILLTVGAAALPASGTLHINLLYVLAN